MKRKTFCLLLSLAMLFLAGCRNNLLKLNNSHDGQLTVAVGVSRALYRGEYLQDGTGRFVAPVSESVSLSYTVGETEYTAAVELEISPDGSSMTGVATLTNLPTGVEGVVNVSTFDGSGVILCDGEEALVLASGENQVTLTLSISELSPFLEIVNPAEYISDSLAPGAVLFLQLPGLTPGTEYEMFIYQEEESPEPPEMAVITSDGEILETGEVQDSDYGVLSFTLPSDATGAVVCFYNPHDYTIPGLIWIDQVSEYSSLVYGGMESDYQNLGDSGYYRIAAAGGKVYLVSHSWNTETDDGIWISDDHGASWNRTPIRDTLIPSGDLDPYYASVSDLIYREGSLHLSLYQDLSDVGLLGNAVYNINSGSVTQIMESWATISPQSVPFEQLKTAKSATHTFLAYIDSGDTLTLYSRRDGSSTVQEITVGNFTTSATTYNELQVCAIDDMVYILGDKIVYSWQAGAAALSEVLTMSDNIDGQYRYLSLFKDKYLVAGNGNNSYLYLPETEMVIPVVTYDEIQTYLPDPGLQDIYVASIAAQDYLFDLTIVTGEGSFEAQALNLTVMGSGGFQLIGEAIIPAGDLPTGFEYLAYQIVMDEETGTIYLGSVDNIDGYEYLLYRFTLQ